MESRPNPPQPPSRDELIEERNQLRTQKLLMQERDHFSRELHKQSSEVRRDLAEGRRDLETAMRTYRDELRREVGRRVFAVSVAFVLALGLTGFTVLATVQTWSSAYVQDATQARLEQEFSAPELRASIAEAATQAAERTAATIIEESVKPSVESLEYFVRKERDELIEEVRRDTLFVYAELESLQKELGTIQQLHDVAIEGDPSAYYALVNYTSDAKDVVERARGAAAAVKFAYLGKTRVAEHQLALHRADGSVVPEEELSTEQLIQILQGSENREDRGRAAHLLRNRRGEGVAEALLTAMATDDWMWVRTDALNSFAHLTGFRPSDVFGFEQAQEWYRQHAADTRSRMKLPAVTAQ